MSLFGVVLTAIVLIAVAVLIWAFEGKRARQIERDLGASEDRVRRQRRARR